MARTDAQIDALLLPFADGTSAMGDWSWTAESIVGGVRTPGHATWTAAPLGNLYIYWDPLSESLVVVSDEGAVNYLRSIDSVAAVVLKRLGVEVGPEQGWETGAARDVIECRTSDPTSPAPGQMWFRSDL